MPWMAIFLLLLAGLYVAIERGQSTRDRVLRWMVITGALLLAFLIGSGVLR
jgi:hypothetical protein